MTTEAGYELKDVYSRLCINCDQPIGKLEWKEVRTLARFGQMFFEHAKCPVEDIARARNFAIEHIRHDVERGVSEHSLQLSWHGSTSDERWVQIGLHEGWKPGGKFWPPSKIVVSKMDREECLFVFSLHELYQEIKGGQLSLL